MSVSLFKAHLLTTLTENTQPEVQGTNFTQAKHTQKRAYAKPNVQVICIYMLIIKEKC